MKISIFGLGYVGSVSAACLAGKDNHVIGVDSNQKKVDMINAGKALIIEPGLTELTANVVANGYLRATIDVNDAILNSSVSFICVETPSKKSNDLDLQYVKRVCTDIGHILKEKNEYHILIFRSTMFPGSIRNVVIPLLEHYSDKIEGDGFSVCISPEFLKEGSAVYDYYHPPKNVVGTSDVRVRNFMNVINALITNMPTIFLTIEEAEMLKYVDNIWQALKIGFANEIGIVCNSLNIDSHQVIDVLCKDAKLNMSSCYLKPSLSFASSYFAKDLCAFLYESQRLNVNLPIISAVLPSNKTQIERVLNLVIEQNNKNIGVLGFFKENIDDLCENPIVEIIKRLIGKGYTLTLFDENVSEAKLYGVKRDYILNHIPHLSELMVESIEELVDSSQTIIIGNKAAEFEHVFDLIKSDHVVIDLVRIRKTPPKIKQYVGIYW